MFLHFVYFWKALKSQSHTSSKAWRGFIQALKVLSGLESSNFAASVVATNCLVFFSEPVVKIVCFSRLPKSLFCITYSIPSLQQNSIFMSLKKRF